MNKTKILQTRMRCFLEDGRFLWCIPEDGNVLCKYNLDLHKITVMYAIPYKGAYSAIIKWEERLMLVPYSAEDIIIYNIDLEKFDRVELPKISKQYRKGVKFYRAIRKEKEVYLIPGSYPYFLKINLDNLKIVMSEDISQICFRLFDVSGNVGMETTASVWNGDDTVFFGCGDREENICVGKLELGTLNFKIMKSKHVKSWIKGMVWHKENVFLYSGDGKIVVLNQDLEEIEVISDLALHDFRFPWDMDIAGALVYGEKIYYLRTHGLDTIVLNTRDGYMVTKEKLIKESFLYADIVQDGLLIQSDQAGYFYFMQREEEKKMHLRIESEVIQNCFKETMKNDNRVFYENRVLQLLEWSLSIPAGKRNMVYGQNRGKTIFANGMYDL